MGFSRQEYWGGLPCPPPGDLSNPGIKPEYLMSPAFFITSATWEAKVKFVTVTLSKERTSVGVLGLNLRSREGVLGLLLADVRRGAIQGVGLAVRKLGNSLMVISVGQTKGSNAQNSPSQASAIREP